MARIQKPQKEQSPKATEPAQSAEDREESGSGQRLFAKCGATWIESPKSSTGALTTCVDQTKAEDSGRARSYSVDSWEQVSSESVPATQSKAERLTQWFQGKRVPSPAQISNAHAAAQPPALKRREQRQAMIESIPDLRKARAKYATTHTEGDDADGSTSSMASSLESCGMHSLASNPLSKSQWNLETFANHAAEHQDREEK